MKSLGYYFVSLVLAIFPVVLFSAENLSDQVVIRRTTYGVPHIYADNLRAAGYAMGYVQVEDYGSRVVNGLVRVRGEWGKYEVARDRERQIDNDAANRRKLARAEETYPLLSQDVRDILEGFAEGVNRYIVLNPEEFQNWLEPRFTGVDVHALGIVGHSGTAVTNFLKTLKGQGRGSRIVDETEDRTSSAPLELETENLWARVAETAEVDHPDDGSNVWAFAPSRTTSGKAILMRNPHLTWTAGYYEAHVVVPGKLDFYGDFRIGSPIGIVCGFNRYLGWSTTNNYTDTDEIYALELATDKSDHYMLDGEAHPLLKDYVTIESKTKTGIEEVTREFVYTPHGPVIHRDDSKIYVIRAAEEGEYRSSGQFLQMMMARNLEEWKDAMRINARHTSNFTYADADGNILYVWNAKMPDLPHPSGGDTTAVLATRSEQIWSKLIPWDNLPQLLNPKGGYVRNENDPFHHTNLHEVFDAKDFPTNFPQPILRLRSQLSLELIGGEEKFSLEDVVALKHDMKALLADRVKDDLILAVRDRGVTGQLAEALAQLERWDNTVAADSKGGLLFDVWWSRYVSLSSGGRRVASTPESAGYAAPADSLFAEIWSLDRPAATPRGLASPSRAVEAFEWAVEECENRYGSWDLTWGDVHRARIGSKEFPVGGGAGGLGCFRILTFRQHAEDEKKREVAGGDGWVLAVEFGEKPRAYSILAYGQSNRDDSPHFNDQLEMFTDNEMKLISFTEEEVLKQVIREYRPGE